MKNGLDDLNNILFETLEHLNDRDIKGDDLKNEIERSRSICTVSGMIIDNAKIQLDAVKVLGEYDLSAPKIFLGTKEDK